MPIGNIPAPCCSPAEAEPCVACAPPPLDYLAVADRFALAGPAPDDDDDRADDRADDRLDFPCAIEAQADAYRSTGTSFGRLLSEVLEDLAADARHFGSASADEELADWAEALRSAAARGEDLAAFAAAEDDRAVWSAGELVAAIRFRAEAPAEPAVTVFEPEGGSTMLMTPTAAELAELAGAYVRAERRLNAAFLRYDALCEADPAHYRDAEQEIAGHQACGITAALDASGPIHRRLLALMVAAGVRAVRLGDVLLVACVDTDHRGRAYPAEHDEIIVIEACHVLPLDGSE